MNETLDQQIERLKAEHGTLFRLDLPYNNGEATILLKSLDRVTYAAAAKLLEKDEMLATETILRSLTVGGDITAEDVIKDFESLRAAAPLLVEIITPKTGNVTRL